MTLRDLFSAYAPELLVVIWIHDKGNSSYLLRVRFEDGTGHDFEIFEKYSDATVLEWYVGAGCINILLDIEKF